MPSNPGYPPDDQQQHHHHNYNVQPLPYYDHIPQPPQHQQHGFYQRPPPQQPQQHYSPYPQHAYPSAPFIQQPPPTDFSRGLPHSQSSSSYPFVPLIGPDSLPDLGPQHRADQQHSFVARPSFEPSPTPLAVPTPPSQTYPLHQSSSSPYAQNSALSGVASPAWVNPSHQPQQQQQQQQQLQAFPPHLAINGASPSASFPVATPTPPPAPVPSEQQATVSPTKPPPKITLRLPLGSASTNSDPTMASRSRRASAATVKTDPEPSASGRPQRSSRGAAKKSYYEDDDDGDFEEEDSDARPNRRPAQDARSSRRSGRTTRGSEHLANDDDFEDKMMDTSPVIQDVQTRRGGRKRVIDPDDDDEDDFVPDANGGHDEPAVPEAEPERDNSALPPSQARTRHSSADAESFAPEESEQDSPSPSPDPIEDDYEDDDESVVSETPQRRRTRASVATRSTRNTRGRRADPDSDEEYGARRNLRKRDSRPNYQLPPMDISAEIAAADIMNKAIAAASGPRGRGRAPGFGGGAFGALGGASSKPFPWSMKGKDFARVMGDPDSSDSDDNLQPMANAAAGPSALGGPRAAGGPGGVPGPTDVPNFGRVNPKSSMADADPLGVDVNVTFDRVGGLDDHINQLKEMVALPLLYPELFQQFNITPPRGVLFHGPPGTGKTLLARALAASCSNGNTKIAFFMRKGADVLSKWVGEAERQLRMLFEEARASQPSIIFFDEIDGLAPVRSSKQDQIHASLVSTLLALMDGMDGRGQVIVIGATNRPDAVDPALRRPGRFDREFYFPLPNREARKSIIRINTRNWEPALPDKMVDTLSTITKGYGGSDLRALCTEAALNAIQRRYPQIYKTTDRLQVQPGSVHVQPKDFMLAVKKIVPSSARSASSAAIQLPTQLVPLLSKQLDALKAAVDRAIPPGKKRTALEEAEYEDEDGDTFEKEMMLQSLDKLRTYRPRLLVYGPAGSGQTYLGPAILHHLEGFHVQSLDLATLMSDSTRTPEAAIVQLFVEAKRHQPSIIFIPSLAQWSHTVSETTRSTARALLDGIPPSDPILLLAIVDGPLDTLPGDVRAWFGFGDENRLQLGQPKAEQREEFFSELLAAAARPPVDFPDGVPRKRRVLEILPPAPPLPPRQPTEAEVAREAERDLAARNMLFVSFSSLVSEFMKKYRRPVAFVKEDAFQYAAMLAQQAELAANPPKTPPQVEAETVIGVAGDEGGAIVVEAATAPADPVAVDGGEGALVAQAQEILPPPAVINVDAETTAAPTPAPVTTWQAHDMDIDTIQRKLVRHKYFTPNDFLADVALIEENAKYTSEADRQIRVSEMVAHARMHVQSFDQKWIPEFERYAVRMRERKEERAKAKEAAAKEAADKEAAEREAAGKETDKAPADEGTVNTGLDGGAAEASTATVPEANGLKRAREDEEGAAGSEGPVEKRPREDAMDVDSVGPAPESGTPGASVNGNGNAQAAPAVDPASVASRNGSATPHPAPAAPTAPASPEPVLGPLVVPDEALKSLGVFLRDGTAVLTVEQLEQLRAALLDRVWRQRANWDRTALVEDMTEFAGKFVSEVEEIGAELD